MRFKSQCLKVCKGAIIRIRYNQVPHLTQDTNGKVTNSQLDTTNESLEVSPFPAGDHKAHINRCAQRHSKHKTEQKHKRSTKEVPPWNSQGLLTNKGIYLECLAKVTFKLLVHVNIYILLNDLYQDPIYTTKHTHKP